MLKISAILLGAGESKRMGSDKLSLPWGNQTVLEHCLTTLLKSKVNEIVVVLSHKDWTPSGLFQNKKVKTVVNPLYRKGMSTSLRKGLRRIQPDSEGLMIALGDQPFLKTRTVNALIAVFGERKEGIILPSFRGRMGHPVIFSRKYKKELLSLKGDVGGRSIIEKHSNDIRRVPVKSTGVVKDIDTWQDYLKELKKHKRKPKEIREGV